MRRAARNDLVRIRYVAKLESGELVEQTETGPPREIRLGAGEEIEGLENALIGMTAGEKKTINLGPEEAYGERDERLKRTILRANFPPGFEPRVGEIVGMKTPKGEQLPAMIKEVDDQYVTVDFNHPLAGQALIYEVEVVGIG